jgi:hypothetical protein
MELIEQLESQYQKMVEKDQKAKAKGTMVGRYIAEPYADSYAYYEIVKVNTKTVRIKSLDIYDGWTIPYWGAEATIDREYAMKSLAWRDRIDEYRNPKN